MVRLMFRRGFEFLEGGGVAVEFVAKFPGCLYAYGADGVVKQRFCCGISCGAEYACGGYAGEGFFFAGGVFGGTDDCFIGRIGGKEVEQGGFPCAVFFFGKCFEKGFACAGFVVVGHLDGAGAVTVGCHFGFVAVVFPYVFRCLQVGFVAVAHGAGVGDAEFDAHLRVGAVEGVVTPRVARHVVAFRHVAFDASCSLAALRAGSVLGDVDDGAAMPLTLVPLPWQRRQRELSSCGSLRVPE